MSQPAGTERTPPGRGGGGNLLTRRIGGVPGYAWVALVALVAGGVFWFVNKRKSAAAASTSTPQGPTQATCYDANGNTVACSDPSAVGSNATDYFEALYAQGQGINSQLENQGQLASETGLDVDQLQQLIKDLQGDVGEPVKAGTPPGEPGPLVKIPAVAGKRAAFAVDQLHSLGFTVRTDPLRKPIAEYDATGTTPPAGQRVPARSAVTVHVREIAGGRKPLPVDVPAPGTPRRKAA